MKNHIFNVKNIVLKIIVLIVGAIIVSYAATWTGVSEAIKNAHLPTWQVSMFGAVIMTWGVVLDKVGSIFPGKIEDLPRK